MNEIGALEVDDLLVALVEASGMPGDDAEALLRARGAPVEHDRFGAQRVARIDRLMIRELVDAEERPAALAQILDGQAEHGGEHQQRIGDDAGMTVRAGVGGVVVVRIEMQRQGREEGALRLGDRAAPMMAEDATGLEILVAVALGDEPRPRPEIVCHCLSGLMPSLPRAPVRPRRRESQYGRWFRAAGVRRRRPGSASPGRRTWSRARGAAWRRRSTE